MSVASQWVLSLASGFLTDTCKSSQLGFTVTPQYKRFLTSLTSFGFRSLTSVSDFCTLPSVTTEDMCIYHSGER